MTRISALVGSILVAILLLTACQPGSVTAQDVTSYVEKHNLTDLKDVPPQPIADALNQAHWAKVWDYVHKATRPIPSGHAGGVWKRLRICESNNNYSINTGNGYYGAYQFSLSTWRSVGGSGYPHNNSPAEQDKRAQILQARSGWGQWPACSRKLGLR